MISVQNMGNSFLRVNLSNDFVRILFLAGCENNDFEKLRHLEQESVQAKSFDSVNFGALSIEGDLQLKMKLPQIRSHIFLVY